MTTEQTARIAAISEWLLRNAPNCGDVWRERFEEAADLLTTQAERIKRLEQELRDLYVDRDEMP